MGSYLPVGEQLLLILYYFVHLTLKFFATSKHTMSSPPPKEPLSHDVSICKAHHQLRQQLIVRGRLFSSS